MYNLSVEIIYLVEINFQGWSPKNEALNKCRLVKYLNNYKS